MMTRIAMRWLAVLCLGIASVMVPVSAATVQGFSSCAEWLAERQKDAAASEEAWIMGYLSGANMWMASRKDILKMIEAKDAYAWVDRYCRANKSGDTADAVDELVKDLQKR
ncbi:MAG: hypothetical protein FJY25_09390 [Betaproteobacteria bacterium]|nr:hypothetical protein [Betaproteobacteria bacterium]